MSKAEDIAKRWQQIKALNKDVETRSILDAVSQYDAGNGDGGTTNTVKQVNTDRYQKPQDVPAGYTEALTRLKQYQTVLTPALLSKYPDAQAYYNNITKQGVERMKTFQQKLPDYYLTPEEQQKLLGKDYNQYQKDMTLVSGYLGNLYPGLTEVRGTEEQSGNTLLYGLRSASLGQYTGEPRVPGNEEDITKYSRMSGIQKD